MTYGCCAPSADITKFENAEILSKEKLGNGYLLVENDSKTFMLCYKIEEKKNQPHSSLSYFVYDMKSQRIVLEENLFDAEIKWLNDHNIEIRINPEIISADDDVTVFILNVLTKEKQKLNLIN